MPWQLGDGFRSSLFDVDVETGPQTSTLSKQMLCHHPHYRDAVLIRDPLHCFHRSDGQCFHLVDDKKFDDIHRLPLDNVSERRSKLCQHPPI